MSEMSIPTTAAMPARPEPNARAVARSLAGGQFAIYAVLIILFFAPFISVSCGDSVTRPMSGAQLASGSEPTILISSSSDPMDRRAIEDAVDGARRLAMLMPVFLILAIAGAAFLFAVPAVETAYLALTTSYLAAGIYLAFFLGVDLSTDASVHHELALNVSMAFVLIPPVLAIEGLRRFVLLRGGAVISIIVAIAAAPGWILLGAEIAS